MKYDLAAFNQSVQYYKKGLAKLRPENKRLYILGSADNAKAFFSLAPLSCAAHESGYDVYCTLKGQQGEFHKNIYKIWKTYHQLGTGVQCKETAALKRYIAEAAKKAKDFEKLFEIPGVFVFAIAQGFMVFKKGDMVEKQVFDTLITPKGNLPEGMPWDYHTGWFTPYKERLLAETSRKIWKEVYTLKPSEQVGIGFELIPVRKKMTLPFEDYLDSYAIIHAMHRACLSRNISLSADTARDSVLDFPEKTGDLAATFLGCELDKTINEPVFRRYAEMAALLHFKPLRTNDAVFSIHGKGYGGKHIFGESIGYPTMNRKARWQTPGGIIYKFHWLPQSRQEDRDPRCRVAFTETLPIDVFIKSCNVDWAKMRRDNQKLMDAINQSEHIVVESGKSNFKVYLKDRKGNRRIPYPSDSDVQTKINPIVLKEKGRRTGCMANLPGGEAFLTPEYIDGVFYGDVVIAIDQSYLLDPQNPLVVECSSKGYTIKSGEPRILKKIKEKKQEAWKSIEQLEQSRSAPPAFIRLMKENFNKVGEFAINTNPHAKLCDYLIVNEKIAGMIHIALGSGYDEDRHTEYHYDIVINARKQRLDIYGVQHGKKIWMLRNGKFIL